MKSFSDLAERNRPHLRIVLIRNEYSTHLTPSYQIRLTPLARYLYGKDHTISELNWTSYLSQPIEADVIIFQRFASEDLKTNLGLLPTIIDILRMNSQVLIWDLDDDLFQLPDTRTNSRELNQVLEDIIVKSDIITVSTNTLNLKQNLQNKSFLFPNYPQHRIVKNKFSRKRHSIDIGYLGNFDRISDILFVLKTLDNSYPQRKVNFHTYGLPNNLKVEVKASNKGILIHSYEKMPYLKALKHYSKLNLHFSIAPLSQNCFNESKSAIKYIDYMSNKAPILISRVGEISDILLEHELLPPINVEDADVPWKSRIDSILNFESKTNLEENRRRIDFTRQRNKDKELSKLQELETLIIQRTKGNK